MLKLGRSVGAAASLLQGSSQFVASDETVFILVGAFEEFFERATRRFVAGDFSVVILIQLRKETCHHFIRVTSAAGLLDGAHLIFGELAVGVLIERAQGGGGMGDLVGGNHMVMVGVERGGYGVLTQGRGGSASALAAT